jgi:gentisate 1,2-dioxygenase
MKARAQPAPDRQAFYRRIDPLNLTPLWEAFTGLITPEPASPCQPFVWHYDAVRPHLMESGQIISAHEAERRVLILENPGLRGHSSITRSLYAGLQLVLPGEVAPCHRHAQSALRLVLEGHHGYTGVNGERILMERGDFIITPPWCWHDHGNDTASPVVWLDGLDIPLVQLLDASFIERFETEQQPESRPTGDTVARYGNNLLPVGTARGANVLNHYPYARSREALDRMSRTGEWNPHHGLKLEFVNPTDGGPAMPTISTFLHLLPQGFRTEPYRSTDGTVFTAIEGRGVTEVNGKPLEWGPNDTFVVPSWVPHRHRVSEESVLFSFSDRGIQQKLGLWREKLG